MNLNYRLILALILFSVSPFKVVKADVLDDLAFFVKAGDSKAIAGYFAPVVDMTILSQEDEYSQAKAEALLRDFFSKHAPSAVKIIHRITSNPEYRLVVFTLSAGGGNYRVSISLKNTSGKFLITEMRIEPNG